MANRRYIDFPIASSVGDSDIILIWQSGANKQTTKATFLSGLPENLDELNDVAISGLTNGQILRYDSVTGKWENTDQGNLDLNDLNDVSIVSPSNGQVLVYNTSTSKWENSSGGFVPYTGAVTTVNLGAQTIQAGSFVKAGGTSAQFLKANGSVDSTAYGTGSVTSVALTMPSAFSVANSPVTTAGTLAVTGAGTVGQYIRGDGSLADFPESSGGGSSVSYYLNGSVAQGTIGGVAYKELNKVPILGAGTDFTINANGYITSFITDAGDPNLLEIPAGNWTFETYFSASSNGGSPSFYVELYKVNSGRTATLIASNSTFPELIAFGTNIISYFSTLAVPTTALALTDRLAIRYYVTHSGRTITLHTEDNHLCQIITTFTTGLTALNGLTAQIQNFAVGTSGTDFAIASATATHTFNLPTASATNRGALSSADWTTFNNKTSNLGTVTSVGLSSATSGVTIGSSPVTTSGTITLAIATASGSQNGLLSSTDWTTFNSKQNALTNPVTGTGTSGQVAYFTGTTAISSESNLFWDATNDRLGIGTNLPANTLDLQAATTPLRIVNTLLPANQQAWIKLRQASNNFFGADIGIDTTTGGDFVIGRNNATDTFTETFRIARANGNVLINSQADNGAKLQVSGTATISSSLTVNTTVTIKSFLYLGESLVENGVINSPEGIYINADSDASGGTNDIVFGKGRTSTSGGTTFMTIKNGGNVGIGTPSPASQSTGNTTGILDVSASSGGNLVLHRTGSSDTALFSILKASNGTYIDSTGAATAANNAIIFRVNNNNADQTTVNETLRIASTGTATFSGLGDDIVIIGKSTASQNSYLQLNAGSAANAYINSIGSGSLILGANGAASNHITILSSGNVGINTNNPANRLDVHSTTTPVRIINTISASNQQAWIKLRQGTASSFGADIGIDTTTGGDFVIGRNNGSDSFTEAFRIIRASGNANFTSLGTGTVTATAGTLSTVSDLNYKIEDGFIDSAIEKVLNLKPRYFYWNEKSGLPKDVRQLGFYAQEVNEALGEEAANKPKNENTPWGISDRSMIAYLTKAIQELKQEIDTLKN